MRVPINTSTEWNFSISQLWRDWFIQNIQFIHKCDGIQLTPAPSHQASGKTIESPVFYRSLSPSGPLSCLLTHLITNLVIQNRAMGVADFILPLGHWFSVNTWKKTVEKHWVNRIDHIKYDFDIAFFAVSFYHGLLVRSGKLQRLSVSRVNLGKIPLSSIDWSSAQSEVELISYCTWFTTNAKMCCRLKTLWFIP